MSETGTAIERRIDRETAGAITIQPHSGGMAAFSIQPRSMGEVLEFAKLLAISGPCIPKDFRNNAGACLALVLQALKWGADPYAVANKAFIVNDRVGYEAQLVNAIVNSSTMLSKRLDCVFEGDGSKRRCRVVGYIKGEADPREYVSPEVGAIPVKNSPLWKGDPDQQLFYYASRAWARRWLPEVLLGIYTPEELTPTVELHPWAKEASPEVEPRERDRRAGQSQLEQFEERHTGSGGAERPFANAATDQDRGSTSRGQTEEGQASSGDTSGPTATSTASPSDEKAVALPSIVTVDGEIVEAVSPGDLRTMWDELFRTPMSPDQIIGMWQDNAAVRALIYETFGSAALNRSYERYRQAEREKRASQPGQVPGGPNDEQLTLAIDEGWGIEQVQAAFREMLTEIAALAPELHRTTIERFRQLNGAVEIKLNQKNRAWMERHVHPVYAECGVRL